MKLTSHVKATQDLSSVGSSSQFPGVDGGPHEENDGYDGDEGSHLDGADGETGARTLPDPIWDLSDNVFRCTKCSFDVIDGFCHACVTVFRWDVVRYMSLLIHYITS